MLNGFRALDLTDEKGFFCGTILSRLGVDVIKVEKPGGDDARTLGPFYHDTSSPEKSLVWFARNVGKRGVTLDIGCREGQDILMKLAATADFVIESFPVGYLDGLGLGYRDLRAVNPRVIVTSITSFGQTGPMKHFKSSDLVAMATGGIMAVCGDPDGPPLRLSPDHAYYLTGTNAAAATMIAHYYREMISGEGQHVDVSMHECVVRENHMYVGAWEFLKVLPTRMSGKALRGRMVINQIWPCIGGHVFWHLEAGRAGAGENKALAQWLDDENIPGIVQRIDFDSFAWSSFSQEMNDEIEQQVASLTSRHTKEYLESQALQRGIRLSALNDIAEVFRDEQLKYRNFWVEVDHPELSDSLTYPGHLFVSNEVTGGMGRRPPLIREHNEQVYVGELGLSREEFNSLRGRGVV